MVGDFEYAAAPFSPKILVVEPMMLARRQVSRL